MKKIILPLLTSLLFASSSFAAFNATDVLGTWEKDCQNIDGDYVASQIKIEKRGSQFQWTDLQTAFEEDKCGAAYLQLERQYNSSFSGSNVDLILSDVAYVSLTDEVTEALNSIQFCGMTNWQTNRRQSILDKTCDQVGNYSAGQKLYSIFKTTAAKELFVGMPDENFDGSSPAKRYLQFESTAYKKRR